MGQPNPATVEIPLVEYTPGPWGVWAYDEDVAGWCVVGPSVFETVADVRAGHAGQDGRVIANARLMAAAPDLVAALKAYRTAQPQCECSEHSGCAMAAARALADVALSRLAPDQDGSAEVTAGSRRNG